MTDALVITGTTVGDISYVVAYYDVNSGNLYDANGNMYGNNTLSTTLDNEFILELHYVQEVSTNSDPTTWAVWNGLEGKTVDSSLAFDSDYKHAFEGIVAFEAVASSHEITVMASSVDKDTLNSEGNLIINPYGLEPEQIIQGSTITPRMVVPYDSFEYVSSTTSGITFKFHVADADGLMYAIPANTQVRVSDPLYLYVNPSSIYEVNIPSRYNEGVFKFPMNIMSRKLLKALDYTGATGVNGTLEHKISVRRDTLTGVSYNSNTYTRDKDKDVSAVYNNETFLFCGWVTGGTNNVWTEGNDVQANTAVYNISGGTATLLGSTANPVTETDYVLFRTFAFPFLVKNLIDYNATIDIPMQDVDWAKDYIISIIKNNMEEITGRASQGAYGVVLIGTNIDVDNGVISVKDASTSDKGVIQIATSEEVTAGSETSKAVVPSTLAVELAKKQDNMSNGNVTTLNTTSGAKIDVNVGDGLVVGVSGTTNANKLIVNEASVKEVLEDVVDGGAEPAVNEIVTADNLRGALSVGQAVDVSCAPISISGGTITPDVNGGFLSGVTWVVDAGASFSAMGYAFTNFPKFADGLVYLWIFDIENQGSASAKIGKSSCTAVSGTWIDVSGTRTLAAGDTKRVAVTFNVARPHIDCSTGGATLRMTNYRIYEVTALTDEAIAYIAQLPDPDAFFRSTSAYSIRDKYLIKQDMVCPFIPTINMPDNSDLTVAAGLSYKIKYTNDNPHTITADTIPTDAYGWDTHIQMFIKGTSSINFQKPLILMDALTPNAGHNLSVKWRNGDALVYVDDTNAGYIVVTASGTGAGTLNFGIVDPSTDYVIFAAGLDGTTVDAGTSVFGSTATTLTTLNILGNGTDATIITGNIGAASGKTINFQSLTIDGGTFSGAGAFVFSNIKIADGSTVACVFGDTNPSIIPEELSGGTLDLQGGTISLAHHVVDMSDMTIVNGGTGNFTMYETSTSDRINLSNCVITGFTTNSGVVNARYGKVYITDCDIHGNTATYYGGFASVGKQGTLIVSNTTFANNGNKTDGRMLRLEGGTASLIGCNLPQAIISTANSDVLYVKDCTDIYTISRYGSKTTMKFIFGGTNTITGYGIPYTPGGYGAASYIYMEPDSLLDFSASTQTTENVIGTDRGVVIGYLDEEASGVASWKATNGVIATISGCTFGGLDVAGRLNYFVVAGNIPEWDATNVIFASPLDATATNTIKLTGTTFTSASKVLNANRIQLPASTTVSFQGNTNDADIKILSADLIVVGDNPASPSGTATIVNASGVSSTITGIGTYIDKEGDNDFVVNNTTNVVPVDNSTTGAKYLGTVLSAATGDTGANKYAKIDSGAVAVVNEATNAVDKNIITHDYEPILGGTFSLTSATVNEATKTTTILSGGIMSVVDIHGSKDGVIDLGATRLTVSANKSAYLSGCVFSNGSATNQGTQLNVAGASAYAFASNCSFGHNAYVNRGGVAYATSGGFAELVNCEITNVVGSGSATTAVGVVSGTATLVSCLISGNTGNINYLRRTCLVSSGLLRLSGCSIVDIVPVSMFAGGTCSIAGSNYLNVPISGSDDGIVTISSGAILDLTGNTNATPIAPGGGITFGANVTIINSAGSSVSLNNGEAGTCTVIKNDGTIE